MLKNSLRERLAQLGHDLPNVKAPAANYVRATRQGNLLFIAGQIGQTAVADELTDTENGLKFAQDHARLAALNLLAVLDAEVQGEFSRIERIQRLGVFIAAPADFAQHSVVADGASNLLVDVFGERGRHARTAVGVASLPAHALVEVDAIVQLRDSEPA